MIRYLMTIPLLLTACDPDYGEFSEVSPDTDTEPITPELPEAADGALGSSDFSLCDNLGPGALAPMTEDPNRFAPLLRNDASPDLVFLEAADTQLTELEGEVKRLVLQNFNLLDFCKQETTAFIELDRTADASDTPLSYDVSTLLAFGHHLNEDDTFFTGGTFALDVPSVSSETFWESTPESESITAGYTNGVFPDNMNMINLETTQDPSSYTLDAFDLEPYTQSRPLADDDEFILTQASNALQESSFNYADELHEALRHTVSGLTPRTNDNGEEIFETNQVRIKMEGAKVYAIIYYPGDN
jgi:hypothetical protein